jgi:hypothetical protein
MWPQRRCRVNQLSNVVLVGLGGTGSVLAEPLARLLAFHPRTKGVRLELWDGDRYDEDNHARQLGAETGRNKAMAWMTRLAPIMPGVSATPDYISSPVTWEDADILILAVDNWATRRKVLESPPRGLVVLPGNEETIGTCSFYQKDGEKSMLVGGLAGAVYIDGIGVPPILPDVKDQIPRRGGCPGHAVKEPQTIGANMMAATLALWGITNWLDGKDVWPLMSFDLRRMEVARG